MTRLETRFLARQLAVAKAVHQLSQHPPATRSNPMPSSKQTPEGLTYFGAEFPINEQTTARQSKTFPVNPKPEISNVA